MIQEILNWHDAFGSERFPLAFNSRKAVSVDDNLLIGFFKAENFFRAMGIPYN